MVDDFARAGYRLVDTLADGRALPDHWILVGDEQINGTATELEVLIRPSYPFTPPKVRATDGSGGNSWHRDPDGWLCLWDDATDDPGAWAARGVIIDRVQGWFQESVNGWPDDAPDLDLDRYWDRGTGLVLFGDLPTSGWVRVAQSTSGPTTLRKIRGAGNSKKRGRAAGYVIDIGEPDRPPRTLVDLLDRTDEVAATTLQHAIDKHEVHWIVVRYQRRGHAGVLVLNVKSFDPPKFESIAAAGSTISVRRLRSGPAAPHVRASRVLVIGVGGIGSFLVDGLARSGVQLFTLVDGETLLPGNIVRHALHDNSVGWNKAKAMERHLTSVRGLDPSGVKTYDCNIVSLEEAVLLAEQHDVIVDATGNAATAAALVAAAAMLDKPLISVATTMEGRVIRVDRFPVLDGESSAADPQLPPIPDAALYESGCGSPVSPTPPWAVSLAASHGIRAVLAVLTGNAIPPSYVQVVDPAVRAAVSAG